MRKEKGIKNSRDSVTEKKLSGDNSDEKHTVSLKKTQKIVEHEETVKGRRKGTQNFIQRKTERKKAREILEEREREIDKKMKI